MLFRVPQGLWGEREGESRQLPSVANIPTFPPPKLRLLQGHYSNSVEYLRAGALELIKKTSVPIPAWVPASLDKLLRDFRLTFLTCEY